ncbi:hypothetical protein OSC52_15155 [Clostridium pasteurianum]|uniref:hypothetical protein n=1 Tax=Clostridium pasteurianum TaxID=1501 RepID=UPI002260DA90|nr:hypothetical protein [Clostridium pasteurianum]UZW13174.1 hypothetical protein OSC52_15155 [Clostridium pasteurianum]
MSDANIEFHGKVSLFGIIVLFIYFFIILILGLSITVFSLFISLNTEFSYIPQILSNNFNISKGLNIYSLALIGSIGSSLLGNSIYYIRKLYKFSIGKKFILEITTLNDKVENFGTLVYFISRPFFSISFSLLILIGIKSGMFILTGKSDSLNSNIVDVMMFINYFTGFSTGKFLKSLESKSDKIIDSLFNDKK